MVVLDCLGKLIIKKCLCLFVFKNMPNNAAISQNTKKLTCPQNVVTTSTIKLCAITALFGIFLEANIKVLSDLDSQFLQLLV